MKHMRLIGLFCVGAALMAAAAPSARAEDAVLYAAGSLHDAITKIVAAYTAKTGRTVRTVFGSSGVLRERIEKGDRVDLFAASDMEHPRKLHDAGRAASVVMFARNSLCAVATPDAGLTAANFDERVLDPAVKLGTSTPQTDPTGDYTWEMFHLLDMIHPGAFATLDRKAQKVTGGTFGITAESADSVANAFAAGDINTMITYCSGAETQRRGLANGQVIVIPMMIAPTPAYGLAIISPKNPAAAGLAEAILAPEGQAILEQAGLKRARVP